MLDVAFDDAALYPHTQLTLNHDGYMTLKFAVDAMVYLMVVELNDIVYVDAIPLALSIAVFNAVAIVADV